MLLRRVITILLLVSFLLACLVPLPQAHAVSISSLPEPGRMVSLSNTYVPTLIKGITLDPTNPFKFDFVLSQGDNASENLKEESTRLIKYFLAALTIPEKDLWVNLSPYEKDKMLAPNLAQTEMGQEMLAQDYILKQITASLIYPEKELGKEFWNKVYAKAQSQFGTSEIPVNTFNKVWIVADKADVYEKGQSAFVIGGHLKVMLEEDYVALNKIKISATHMSPANGVTSKNVASQIIRDIVLPELEREVNQGKNFAPLRQMFYSMILASWFKAALKDTVVSQVYGNQGKVSVGINATDPSEANQIYERYLKAYKKGVFNYIKEETMFEGQATARKYFSGGLNLLQQPVKRHTGIDSAQLATQGLRNNKIFKVSTMMSTDNLDSAMLSFFAPKKELKNGSAATHQEVLLVKAVLYSIASKEESPYHTQLLEAIYSMAAQPGYKLSDFIAQDLIAVPGIQMLFTMMGSLSKSSSGDWIYSMSEEKRNIILSSLSGGVMARTIEPAFKDGTDGKPTQDINSLSARFYTWRYLKTGLTTGLAVVAITGIGYFYASQFELRPINHKLRQTIATTDVLAREAFDAFDLGKLTHTQDIINQLTNIISTNILLIDQQPSDDSGVLTRYRIVLNLQLEQIELLAGEINIIKDIEMMYQLIDSNIAKSEFDVALENLRKLDVMLKYHLQTLSRWDKLRQSNDNFFYLKDIRHVFETYQQRTQLKLEEVLRKKNRRDQIHIDAAMAAPIKEFELTQIKTNFDVTLSDGSQGKIIRSRNGVKLSVLTPIKYEGRITDSLDNSSRWFYYQGILVRYKQDTLLFYYLHHRLDIRGFAVHQNLFAKLGIASDIWAENNTLRQVKALKVAGNKLNFLYGDDNKQGSLDLQQAVSMLGEGRYFGLNISDKQIADLKPELFKRKIENFTRTENYSIIVEWVESGPRPLNLHVEENERGTHLTIRVGVSNQITLQGFVDMLVEALQQDPLVTQYAYDFDYAKFKSHILSGDIFDEAMVTTNDPVGGIDLNAANMGLTIRKEAGNKATVSPVSFSIKGFNVENFNGFIPVIINITPISNVAPLLGV